ncbi:uncharacterized protein ABDE67_015237 [Symphorus nematophorus]
MCSGSWSDASGQDHGGRCRRSGWFVKCLSVMGPREFWKNYKVLIVMGTSLGLIHWGWYNLKANPLLRKAREDYVPEPGIVAYVSPPAAAAPPLPPLPPPAAAKSK